MKKPQRKGLMAGANAALKTPGQNLLLVLRRDQAYIGVMIDDLVTKGPMNLTACLPAGRIRLVAASG